MPLRQEIAHHTPEQIEGYTRMALEVADRLFEDADDRRAVLPTLIGLFAAKNIVLEQAQPSPLLAGMIGR